MHFFLLHFVQEMNKEEIDFGRRVTFVVERLPMKRCAHCKETHQNDGILCGTLFTANAAGGSFSASANDNMRRATSGNMCETQLREAFDSPRK